MLDLIGFAIVGIIFPTCLLAIASAIAMLLRSLLRGREMQWARLSKALLASLLLELLFLFFGGLLIGITFGRTLGYGFPIVMTLAALLIGAVGFISFLVNGVPGWFRFSRLVRLLVRRRWSSRHN